MGFPAVGKVHALRIMSTAVGSRVHIVSKRNGRGMWLGVKIEEGHVVTLKCGKVGDEGIQESSSPISFNQAHVQPFLDIRVTSPFIVPCKRSALKPRSIRPPASISFLKPQLLDWANGLPPILSSCFKMALKSPMMSQGPCQLLSISLS